jgi:hypothetical protein
MYEKLFIYSSLFNSTYLFCKSVDMINFMLTKNIKISKPLIVIFSLPLLISTTSLSLNLYLIYKIKI